MTLSATFNNPEQDKALVKAVRDCDLVGIIEACDRGADANLQDPATGRNLLFTILDQLDTKEGGESSGSISAQFLALMQRGAEGTLADKAGMTALHLAFDRGNVLLASVMILQPQCAVNVADPHTGDTPLHKALPLFLSPAAEIDTCAFDVLMKTGADPLIPNKAGVTALDIARAAIGERGELAVGKLMETPAVRQQMLRDKARQKNLKLKAS